MRNLRSLSVILGTLALLIIVLFISIHNYSSAQLIQVRQDGTGDHITIQAALDNATNGTTITVHAGDYFENLLINRSITLTGQDNDTTRIIGSIDNSLVTIVSNNVTIFGFSLNSTNGTLFPGISTNRDNITIEQMFISNCSQGIIAQGSYNVRIRSVTFTNNSIGGIVIDRSENISIHSTYHVNDTQGIFISSSENITISNSIFLNNIIRGIRLHKCKDVNLTNNSCIQNLGNGIHITNSNNLFIEGNNCSLNNRSGILIEESDLATIRNNIASRCEDSGISIRCALNIILSGNICANNSYGIRIHYDAISREDAVCSTVTLENNTIKSNDINFLEEFEATSGKDKDLQNRFYLFGAFLLVIILVLIILTNPSKND
jgi:parallel beta-helix repeat protein